ncbi:alkylmercury lyase [Prescottella soli]|uniref:Alkylmercury lyase n=1 Tax=Prescottella soli TaxID=1543852 RepID=A0ABW9FSJ5_9NOCA
MKVEILYFDGCPNWREAGARVRHAAVAAALPEPEITYRRVETDAEAAALPFAGSPTILIDGADAFGGEPVPRLACRVYPTPGGPAGLPTVGQLTDAFLDHT